ncbi:MAG: KEOPS complex kinase/ATPase Bud32 [Candidatus Hydrothermarchaeaceae archaeon]
MKMIGKGAEADVYLDGDTIKKERISKAYRVAKLDSMLRKTRNKKEARLISFARRAGVPTPFIKDIDNKHMAIEMSFIDGKKIRKILNALPNSERKKICEEIGRCAGRLHSRGIIHGDMTTSNLLLSNRIYFIDFGLGEINDAIEAKGVDILVFKKSLRSTHYKHEKECFENFVKGYSSEYKAYKSVLERLNEIERRGRYFEER